MVSKGRRNARPGFTLAELVCVLIILTIIAAIAAPRYAHAIARYRVELAANRIIADLNSAQQYAQSTSSSQSIVFDAAEDTYTLSGRSHPDHPGQAYSVNLSLAPYRVDLANAGFGGDNTLVFSGFGFPDSGGNIRISQGEQQRRITVDAASGQASIEVLQSVGGDIIIDEPGELEGEIR